MSIKHQSLNHIPSEEQQALLEDNNMDNHMLEDNNMLEHNNLLEHNPLLEEHNLLSQANL